VAIKTEGLATGLNVPVGDAKAPEGQTGIGFSIMNGVIVVSITRNGIGLAAALAGDDIDRAAGFMADAMVLATRHEHPSMRTVQ